MSMNPPVFILGAPKSGTTLLLSLLDGHPSLSVVPLELKFFQHRGFPVRTYPRRGNATIADYRISENYEEIKSRICAHKDFSAFKRRERVRGIPCDMFNTGKLFSVLESTPVSSARDLFEAFFTGFSLANTTIDDISHRSPVEKTPLQEEFAVLLHALFPQARFIHIVRNPFSLAVTLRKRIMKYSTRYPRFSSRIISPLEGTWYYLEINRRCIPHYHVLRYEDVISTPLQTMKKVAGFLGIEYDRIITTPTFGGVPWGGNSMFNSHGYRGIDGSVRERWKGTISRYEIEYIARKFHSVLEQYYPDPADRCRRPRPVSSWIPQERESLSTYLLNRLDLAASR